MLFAEAFNRFCIAAAYIENSLLTYHFRYSKKNLNLFQHLNEHVNKILLPIR